MGKDLEMGEIDRRGYRKTQRQHRLDITSHILHKILVVEARDSTIVIAIATSPSDHKVEIFGYITAESDLRIGIEIVHRPHAQYPPHHDRHPLQQHS